MHWKGLSSLIYSAFQFAFSIYLHDSNELNVFKKKEFLKGKKVHYWVHRQKGQNAFGTNDSFAPSPHHIQGYRTHRHLNIVSFDVDVTSFGFSAYLMLHSRSWLDCLNFPYFSARENRKSKVGFQVVILNE